MRTASRCSSRSCSTGTNPPISRTSVGCCSPVKGQRQILDVLQIGAAQVLLETQDSLNFSIAQHCYEHCNSLGWFYDTFRHLYSAASFLNRNAWHQRDIGEGRTFGAAPPAAAARMSRAPLLERIVAAIVALDGPQAVARTKA